MLARVLGGVCSGIGQYLGISGWWVRIAFAALTLATAGFGILLYVLLWLSIPVQTLADLPPILHPGEARVVRYTRPETVLILGASIVGIGILILAQSIGVLRSTGGDDLIAPFMLLIIGLVLLVKQVRG